LHTLLTAAGLEPGGTETIVRLGDASSLVLEQEQERDCDLIVVGRHGENALEAILIGSVTRHVLQQSQGDVLVSLAPSLLDGGAG
jgi:nucleotide-binding universal stress UspA family protein